MDKVKAFLKERSLGFYLAFPAMIIAFITIFLYKSVGVNTFSPTLNVQSIVFLVIGIVVTGISLVMGFIPVNLVKKFVKIVRFGAYLLFLYAFIMFVYSQINYITNIFVAIDGSTFTAPYIITIVFYLLAIILTAVSAGLDNIIPWKKNLKLEEAQNEEE